MPGAFVCSAAEDRAFGPVLALHAGKIIRTAGTKKVDTLGLSVR